MIDGGVDVMCYNPPQGNAIVLTHCGAVVHTSRMSCLQIVTLVLRTWRVDQGCVSSFTTCIWVSNVILCIVPILTDDPRRDSNFHVHSSYEHLQGKLTIEW